MTAPLPPVLAPQARALQELESVIYENVALSDVLLRLIEHREHGMPSDAVMVGLQHWCVGIQARLLAGHSNMAAVIQEGGAR